MRLLSCASKIWFFSLFFLKLFFDIENLAKDFISFRKKTSQIYSRRKV
jgi:hypothetical protein